MNKALDKAWMAVIIPGVFLIVVSVFILALLLIKLLWPWTIPDLFPGSRRSGSDRAGNFLVYFV